MARNYKHVYTWEVHVKARGAYLGKLKSARNRAEGNLNKTSLGNPNQGLALDIYRTHNLALEIALARDWRKEMNIYICL